MVGNTLTFSGHETFHCRQFWLKKGYDHLQAGRSLRDEDAIAFLGVGKNMLSSINHWLQAFGVVSDKDLTELAHFLFHDKTGKDPFLENPGSIWLLHYHLISTNFASIYPIVFNQVASDRIEFDEEHILSQIKSVLAAEKKEISASTLKSDITTFRRNYTRSDRSKGYPEDELNSLLIELDLVKTVPGENKKLQFFRIENQDRKGLPFQLVLYGILLQMGADRESISFQDLLNRPFGVGRIFALSTAGLLSKIQEISLAYPEIVYTSDGGVQQLTIKDFSLKQHPLSVLAPLYE